VLRSQLNERMRTSDSQNRACHEAELPESLGVRERAAVAEILRSMKELVRASNSNVVGHGRARQCPSFAQHPSRRPPRLVTPQAQQRDFRLQLALREQAWLSSILPLNADGRVIRLRWALQRFFSRAA